MAIPTVYKWTDPGAPILFEDDMPGFQDLFQKCLIDGYGSKLPPVSGTNKWTIPFSDATSFILTQGGTLPRKCGVKFTESASASNRWYADTIAAESWTDLTTPVNQWTQTDCRVGKGESSIAAYEIPWIIIATERTIIFQGGYADYDTGGGAQKEFHRFPDTSLSNMHWYFGDYISEYGVAHTTNQLLSHVGSTTTSSSDFNQNFLYNNSTATSYGAKALSGDHENNTEITQGGIMFTRPQGNTSTYIASPGSGDIGTPIFPSFSADITSMYFDKFRMVANSVIMGEMVGVIYPLANGPYPPSGHIYEISHVTGNYSGETWLVFQQGGGGTYIVRTGIDWGVE